MTATGPPGLEDKSPAESKHGAIDASPSIDEAAIAGESQENGDLRLEHATGPAGIKEELLNGGTLDSMADDETLDNELSSSAFGNFLSSELFCIFTQKFKGFFETAFFYLKKSIRIHFPKIIWARKQRSY